MIHIPKYSDFQRIYDNFVKEHGEDKGERLYYAMINKRGLDDTKPMPGKKKSMGNVGFLEKKGEFYTSGYVATTHIDEACDKISVEALKRWETEINDGSLKATPVDYEHDRDELLLRARGVSAQVKQMPDGEYGLYVETHHNKSHPDFESDRYQIEHGFLGGYSIEYSTDDNSTCHFEFDSASGKQVRVLDSDTELYGWALTARPLNTMASIDEYNEKSDKKEIRLVEIKKQTSEVGMMETKNEEQPTPEQEEVKTEATEEVTEEVIEAVVEEEPTPVEPIVEAEPEVVAEEPVAVEAEDKSMNTDEIANKVIESKNFKEAFEKLEAKNKVQVNEGESMTIEMKSYVKAMQTKDSDIGLQFKSAGMFADSLGLTQKYIIDQVRGVRAESREYKNFQINGRKLESKALGITTNQNSDTDYLLSAAELADVFDPVIYNALNEKTSTWGILAKDDYSNKGNNQVQFTLKIAANQTAGAYTGNAVTTGQTQRIKYMTKFKKYQVGVAVDGDMIAAARGGPIGDVFAQEVQDATESLMSVMNQALFAEVGAETAAGVIGFEYITDSAGNTSLYNITRSSANKLAPDSATDNYINGASADVTLAQLRQAIRHCVKDGSMKGDLVFFCDPIQVDKIKSLFDDQVRLLMTPNNTKFGFESAITIDGVPVFEDKDCNDDDIFLADTTAHRIAIWVPPTLEMIGKNSDSEQGFVKTYWCTYNRAPRRMVQIYGLATT